MRRWPRRRPSWRPSDIVRPDAGLGPVSSNPPPTAHPAASAPPEAAVGVPARPTTRSSAPTGKGTPTDPAPAERAEPPHAKRRGDRKSTRLNSSHVAISYAVFCLKKKKKHKQAVHNSHTKQSA